jgi:thiol-disulfide isomerase/thioredoxin
MPGFYEIVSRKILPYNNLFAIIFVLVVFSVAGYYIYANNNYKKYSINEKIFGSDNKTGANSNQIAESKSGSKKMSDQDKTILIVVSLFSGLAIIYGIYYLFGSSSTAPVAAVSTGAPASVPSSGIFSQFLSIFKLKSARGSDNNSIALYLLATGALMFGYVMYHYFYTPKYTNPVKKNKVAKAGSTITVHFFTADWCPHCRKAKPAIDDFEKEYSNKKINGRKIIINRVDCTDSEVEEVSKQINQFNVTSFPTVKISDNSGNVFDFDAKITHENLKEFVNSVVNN